MVRLAVTPLIVVGVTGSVHRHAMTGRRVSVSTRGLLDCEAAVHRAGMQLHWLDHTGDEPDSEYAGETSEELVTAHGSNIW